MSIIHAFHLCIPFSISSGYSLHATFHISLYTLDFLYVFVFSITFRNHKSLLTGHIDQKISILAHMNFSFKSKFILLKVLLYIQYNNFNIVRFFNFLFIYSTYYIIMV